MSDRYGYGGLIAAYMAGLIDVKEALRRAWDEGIVKRLYLIPHIYVYQGQYSTANLLHGTLSQSIIWHAIAPLYSGN